MPKNATSNRRVAPSSMNTSTVNGNRTTMEIEERLFRLESRYRAALSAAIVAKCEYFSIVGEPSVTDAARRRAEARWQESEARKRALRSRMAYVEQLSPETMV
jgi:hypothetical protein